jgi:hypothetical protein
MILRPRQMPRSPTFATKLKEASTRSKSRLRKGVRRLCSGRLGMKPPLKQGMADDFQTPPCAKAITPIFATGLDDLGMRRREGLHAVAVNTSDHSPILFQTCNSLSGCSQKIGIGRRNGRPMVSLPPNWADDLQQPQFSSCNWVDDPRFYVNLNEVERRTWRQILSAISINAIAREEGVSRTAIYARIQGNSEGQGGMIGKNFWVLLWWRLRQRLTGGQQ